MLKTALIYGALSGAITIAVMSLGINSTDTLGEGSSSALFGYTIMLLALVLIFIGVKRYRDRELGGVIKFGPAFGLGLAIAAVAGVFYVIGWEINLAATDYAFVEQYPQAIIAQKEAAGASLEQLQKLTEDMAKFSEQYENPLYRLPITFMEIFPVGLLVALFSAAILRNPKAFPAR
ncbi:DUF4199 domain-containing protein [Hyphococcus sp.]|jgi:hypothetical protein|uniref:DUF4199 domain-containing protein n=1 Tax=Hyphococcus sp. TaxID=2038636 RepID=UPI003D0D7F3B